MKTIHVVCGIIKKGEAGKAAIKRELYEELEATIEVADLFCQVHYSYPDFILKMDCFTCHLLNEHLDYRWIDINQRDIT